MKLSTKGRYGLRALADLAMHSNGSPEPLARIARRQNISERYLEYMFGMLRRSGIVRSVKGQGGGYILMRAPEELSVGEVLRVLEGDLSIIEPDIIPPRGLKCCIEKNVWDEVTKRIEAVYSNVTLANLIDREIS